MEDDKEDKELVRLFASARKARLYDPGIEYGFEARVMAKIAARRDNPMSFWVWEWRLIPVFVSLVILIGIWIYAFEPQTPMDLSALAKIGSEEAMLAASLTGE